MITFSFKKIPHYYGECGSERTAWSAIVTFQDGKTLFVQTRLRPGPPTFWDAWAWACRSAIQQHHARFVYELEAILATHGVTLKQGGWLGLVAGMAAFPGDHEVWAEIEALKARHPGAR